MRYEEEIQRVLTEAGPAGVSLRKLALNVYNMSASFFDAPDFASVYRHVRLYLSKHSQARTSLVERLPGRGCYRLNTAHSPQARQLMLQFGTEEADGGFVSEAGPSAPSGESPTEELQTLSLFDAEWAPKPHDPNEPLDLFD